MYPDNEPEGGNITPPHISGIISTPEHDSASLKYEPPPEHTAPPAAPIPPDGTENLYGAVPSGSTPPPPPKKPRAPRKPKPTPSEEPHVQTSQPPAMPMAQPTMLAGTNIALVRPIAPRAKRSKGDDTVYKIKGFIEKYLFIPSYVTLLVSMLVRAGVAVTLGAINSNLPPGAPPAALPFYISLPLDLVVTFGIILAGEILTASNASSVAFLQPKIQAAHKEATEHTVKKKMVTNVAKNYIDAATAPLRNEAKGHIYSAVFAAVVSLAYGAVFEIGDLKTVSWQIITLVVIGLIAPPFFIYEFSAHYKATVKDMGIEAQDTANDVALDIIEGAGDAIKNNTHTDAQIDAVEAALNRNIPGVIGVLRKPPIDSNWYTVKDLVEFFGDEERKRQIGRIVSQAGLAHKYGIKRSDKRNAWIVPGSSVLLMFPGYTRKQEKSAA